MSEIPSSSLPPWFTRQDSVNAIKSILNHFHRRWAKNIEVGFWRCGDELWLEIVEDNRDPAARARLDAIRWRITTLTSSPRRVLRLRRRELKLTQAALAELAGLTRRQIIRLERGQAPFTSTTAEQLAAALDLPVETLLLGPHRG